MKKFSELIALMARLRDPQSGCPWDLKQSEETLKPYIIEEAYELIESIEKNKTGQQKEELGDLLLQIIFLSRIHEEKGNFNIQDVIDRLSEKLINRHPHIFKGLKVAGADEVKQNWEKIKVQEKKTTSIISDYPDHMPALLSAIRISEQAANVGFDWNSIHDVFEKLDEELQELNVEIDAQNRENIAAEIGDILFTVTNMARKLGVNPEFALRSANAKFKKRFRLMENETQKSKQNFQELSPAELNELWESIKKSEKDQ